MAEAPSHVLVIDDDTRLRALLRRFLSESGFRVTTATNAADARKQMNGLDFDALVLDVMMPGESGFELAQSLRKSSNVPILMLTAMGETDHRIEGFERGADDYLAKPFEPRELVLRLKALLRRAQSPLPSPVPVELKLGPLRFDRARLVLDGPQGPVKLTTAEANLLKALAERPGEVVSRERLVKLGEVAGGERAVDVQVTRLRRKIEPDPKIPRYLQTVRGRGYVLRPG